MHKNIKYYNIANTNGELAQLARASALQAEGQGFEPPILHLRPEIKRFRVFFLPFAAWHGESVNALVASGDGGFLFQKCIDKIFYVTCVEREVGAFGGDYQVLAGMYAVLVVGLKFLHSPG